MDKVTYSYNEIDVFLEHNLYNACVVVSEFDHTIEQYNLILDADSQTVTIVFESLNKG